MSNFERHQRCSGIIIREKQIPTRRVKSAESARSQWMSCWNFGVDLSPALVELQSLRKFLIQPDGKGSSIPMWISPALPLGSDSYRWRAALSIDVPGHVEQQPRDVSFFQRRDKRVLWSFVQERIAIPTRQRYSRAGRKAA